jgi:N-acetylmuramoyl-L-alanine amidase
MMTRTRLVLLSAILAILPFTARAEPVAVHNLRLWQAPDHTRLVLDLDGPLEHRLSTTRDPDRIVVELDDARLKDGLAPLDVSRSYLSAIRAADGTDGVLRITLEPRRPVRPQSFLLKPFGQYGHRLVIDLYDEAAVETAPTPEPRAAPPARPALRPTDLIVAIDAGHGGEDPGAIGRRYRTREKDVTLAIARELHKLINAAPGMKAVLIRDGDYYVGLRERRKKASRLNADVFVSIHADSLPGRRANRVRGSSVYALSDRGATSEVARAIADSENASDWIGGISSREADNDVLHVLGDLTKYAAIGDSTRLGGDVLRGMRQVGPLHSERVAQAGFAVLKQPIPALLVETAFISNPEEERLLRDPAHRRRVAQGVFTGLKRATPWILARRDNGGASLQAGPPPSLPLAPHASAAREHVVKPGETLSAIARLYDIHVDALRFLNDIQGNELAVGTRLRIPGRGGDG